MVPVFQAKFCFLGGVAMDNRLLIGLREAAYRLGVSPRTVWSLTKHGKIPAIRLGRRVLYRPSDLEAFLEKLASQSAEAKAEGLANE